MSEHTVPLPDRERRSVRRRQMVVGAGVLLVLGLVVGDRLLARLVEHRLAARLECTGMLRGDVSVHLGGFPFLAEVATRHVSSARVTADRGGPGGRLTHVTMDVRDLRLPAITRLVHPDSATELTIGSASLAATIPYGGRGGPLGSGSGSGASTAAPHAVSAPEPGAVSSGAVSSGSLSSGSLPFDAHLDGVTRQADGIRVQMSISAAAFDPRSAARSCGGL